MTTGARIETARLTLDALSPRTMEYLLVDHLHGASQEQGVLFTHEFAQFVDETFLRIHLDRMRCEPTRLGWFVRVMVRKDDQRVIGHCGFHGTPERVGRAEMGYTVFPEYRRRGYATEAAQGLVDWARRQGSSEVVASVAPSNAASLALVRTLGFRHTATQLDEVDGEEFVFTLGL